MSVTFVFWLFYTFRPSSDHRGLASDSVKFENTTIGGFQFSTCVGFPLSLGQGIRFPRYIKVCSLNERHFFSASVGGTFFSVPKSKGPNRERSLVHIHVWKGSGLLLRLEAALHANESQHSFEKTPRSETNKLWLFIFFHDVLLLSEGNV